jgi:hypothetical protein
MVNDGWLIMDDNGWLNNGWLMVGCWRGVAEYWRGDGEYWMGDGGR